MLFKIYQNQVDKLNPGSLWSLGSRISISFKCCVKPASIHSLLKSANNLVEGLISTV